MPRNNRLQDWNFGNRLYVLAHGIYGFYTSGTVGVLIKVFDNFKMGIVAFQEIKWKESGSMRVKNTTVFYGTYDDKVKRDVVSR